MQWSEPEIGCRDLFSAGKIFALYERCEFSAVCPRSFSDTVWAPVLNRTKREPQTVRAVVQEVLTATSVIASGSDATVVPIAYEGMDNVPGADRIARSAS